jgi:hypothetical protein
MSSHNLQVAETWAKAGVYVFPVGPDKKPLVKWRDLSTTDLEVIKGWWKQWTNSLPAIDLAKSNLVVLDGDRHGGPDGVEGLSRLFKEYQLDTAAIPVVITQGHGRHAWFKQPTDGEPLGNRDKAVRDSGINVRGAGGYVLCPGARMPDGREYKRCPGTPSTIEAMRQGTIPILPPSLAGLLRAPAKPEPTVEPPKANGSGRTDAGHREQSYADAALRNQANDLAAMPPESGRNIELNNAALKMGHMVAAGRIDRGSVEQRLYEASVANGLVKDTGANAVRATIASGLGKGLQQPSPPLQDRPLNGGSFKASLRSTTAPAPDTAELLSICAADIPPKAINWLWPDRFSIGKLGLIVGLPDEGKGQTLSYIMAQITNGDEWPMKEGRAPQGRVILFSDEDDKNDTIAPRLLAAGADCRQWRLSRSQRPKAGRGCSA